MPEQSWRGTTPIWNCETAAQYAPTQPVAQGSRLAHASSDVHEESPYPSLRRNSDIYNIFMTQETRGGNAQRVWPLLCIVPLWQEPFYRPIWSSRVASNVVRCASNYSTPAQSSRSVRPLDSTSKRFTDPKLLSSEQPSGVLVVVNT